ncbi:MAG: hypothetical protein RB292_05125 [Patescibacteria group bacterium]|jgi:hypothetical protein|nr:hypothetical protein [Patescibacteria group bacterium]
MAIRLNEVVSKSDWVKIIILIIVAVVCWGWVWVEFQKPIIPEVPLTTIQPE